MPDASETTAQQEAINRLQQAIELREGFGLHVLRTESRRLVAGLIEGKTSLWVGPGSHVYPRPGQESALADELSGRLGSVLNETHAPDTVLVLDATGGSGWSGAAWQSVFRRLNEARNEIAAQWRGAMLIAVHPTLEAIFAGSAPDLWSIRGPGAVLQDVLNDGTSPLPPVPGPSDLLRAESRLVPLFGREAALAELDQWLNGPESAQVRLLCAPSGYGKTRLAIELAATANECGWHAGFLGPDVNADHAEGLVRMNLGKLLVVVDQAENRGEVLDAVTAALDFASAGPGAVRVMLLSRNAGDWWRQFGDRHSAVAAVARASVQRLAPISAAVGPRSDLFREALLALAAWLQRPGRSDIPDLSEDLMGRPLHLQLASLAWIDGRQSLDDDALLSLALEEERLYWTRCWPELTTADAARLRAGLAAVILNGGEKLDNVGALMARMAVAEPERTAEQLSRIYAREDDGFLPPLEPAPLAEALVDRVLGETSDPSEFLGRALDSPETVLEVLCRLAQRDPAAVRWLEAIPEATLMEIWPAVIAVAVRVGDPVGRVFAERIEAELDAETAATAAEACPDKTVVLMEFAERASRLAVGSANDERDRAAKLGNWSIRLAQCGKGKEALEVLATVRRIFGELPTSDNTQLNEDIVTLLINEAQLSWSRGEHQQAVGLATRAVASAREASTRSLGHMATLAGALDTLGVASALGAADGGGKAAAEEAVGLYRELARDKPAEYQHLLAVALSNLSVSLQTGDPEQALEAAREACVIQRDCAAAEPDRFSAARANALRSVGFRLAALGRHGEALEALQQALDIERPLTAARPNVFARPLARTLWAFAASLWHLDRTEEALGHIDDAIATLEVIAENDPTAVHMLQKVCGFRAEVERGTRPPTS